MQVMQHAIGFYRVATEDLLAQVELIVGHATALDTAVAVCHAHMLAGDASIRSFLRA
jgi:hypothetical protein